jgi:alpha-galactosidase
MPPSYLPLLCALLAAPPATATNNGFPNSLGLTPLRGLRTWNSVRGDINQSFLQAQVDGLLAPIAAGGGGSLFDAGFTDVGIDDAWEACGAGVNGSYHNASGWPLVNLARFPDLAGLTAYARARNVTMSWYGNACGCGRQERTLAEPHYAQDAAALVQYGFSGLKVDSCGNEYNMTAWAAALNATGVPILLENCNDDHPFRPTPLPSGGVDCPYNHYRTSIDGAPNFRSTMWNVLQTLPFLAVSSPGCFAYSDMTTLGSPAPDHMSDPAFVANCNGTRLSAAEARAQFAAFALLSSPLVLGFDAANASERAQWGPIVTHARTLAFNAAWDGEAGRLVARSPGEQTVPLAVGGICELMQNYSLPQWMVVGKRINSTAGGHTAVFAAVLLVGDFAGAVDFTAPLGAMGFAAGARVHSMDGWSGEDTGDVQGGQWGAQGVAAPGGLYRVFYT